MNETAFRRTPDSHLFVPDKSLLQGQVHDVFDAKLRRRRTNTMSRLRRKGTEKANALNAVIKSLRDVPYDRVEAIVDSVDESLDSRDGKNRAIALSALLSAPDSLNMYYRISKTPVIDAQIPELLSHSGLAPLVGTMLERPQAYGMPLGLLFSHTTLHDFPTKHLSGFSPMTVGKEVLIEPYKEDWYLCDELASIMAHARRSNVMTVLTEGHEDLTLMNYRVKMSGLVLQDFQTPEGKVFFKGNFYSPSGKKGRQTLYDACDTNIARMPLSNVDVNSWVFMRPFRRSQVPFEDYVTYAASLPYKHKSALVNYKGEKIDRNEYRRISKEDFYADH